MIKCDVPKEKILQLYTQEDYALATEENDDIMGGNVITLPSDLIKQGRLNEIFSSVQEGDYSAIRGAQKAGMSIDQFEKSMSKAGYKIPANS